MDKINFFFKKAKPLDKSSDESSVLKPKNLNVEPSYKYSATKEKCSKPIKPNVKIKVSNR